MLSKIIACQITTTRITSRILSKTHFYIDINKISFSCFRSIHKEEDEWNGLPIYTPPYIICAKCHFDKCVPLDYKSKKGYHHIYKVK